MPQVWPGAALPEPGSLGAPTFLPRLCQVTLPAIRLRVRLPPSQYLQDVTKGGPPSGRAGSRAGGLAWARGLPAYCIWRRARCCGRGEPEGWAGYPAALRVSHSRRRMACAAACCLPGGDSLCHQHGGPGQQAGALHMPSATGEGVRREVTLPTTSRHSYGPARLPSQPLQAAQAMEVAGQQPQGTQGYLNPAQ